MKGIWTAQIGETNNYQYNGKELHEDIGLGWSDYGARWYDASIGRWNAVDPLADAPNLVSWSPYHYSYNNPILYVDPDGRNPIRGAIAAYRYAKKIYKVYKQVGGRIDKLTSKHFKDAGVEELYDIAGDVFTAFDSHSSGWDRAKAAVDVIVGTDFNKKGTKAVDKMIDKYTGKKTGVYYNKHESGKSYVGKTKDGKSRQDGSFQDKEDRYNDPRDEKNSEFIRSKTENDAKEEEAISIFRNNQESKQGTYNKYINGRSRVNEQFGGGKYDPKKDYN